MKKLKISFDFDSTLAENRMQKLAKKFIDKGADVWVTTSRLDNMLGRPEWNRDLYSVANKLNIPTDKIQITNGADKYLFLKGFDIHFDDSIIEIELIEENLKDCVGDY